MNRIKLLIFHFCPSQLRLKDEDKTSSSRIGSYLLSSGDADQEIRIINQNTDPFLCSSDPKERSREAKKREIITYLIDGMDTRAPWKARRGYQSKFNRAIKEPGRPGEDMTSEQSMEWKRKMMEKRFVELTLLFEKITGSRDQS